MRPHDDDELDFYSQNLEGSLLEMCLVVLPFRNSCYYILNFGKLGLYNSLSETQSSGPGCSKHG